MRFMMMFLVLSLAACAPEGDDLVDEDAGIETDGDVIEDADLDVEPEADIEEELDADLEEEPPPSCEGLDDESDPINLLACCLTDSGAWFYHTFWCSFCYIQERMFGDYLDLLNHMECYDPATFTELPECTELGIESYPTWIFGDGTMVSGLLHYEQLAEYSGCVWE